MPAMQFACPLCAGLFEVDSDLVGQQVICPTCEGLVLVPEVDDEPQPIIDLESDVPSEDITEWRLPPTFLTENSETVAATQNAPEPIVITPTDVVEPILINPAEIDFAAEMPRMPDAQKRASMQKLLNIFWIFMGIVVLAIMAAILVHSQ
jgi:hypothetical protein